MQSRLNHKLVTSSICVASHAVLTGVEDFAFMLLTPGTYRHSMHT